MEWKQLANGKAKVVPDKPTLRKILGRSPDRYDALALSVWEPLALREEGPGASPAPGPDRRGGRVSDRMDPYAASRKWERR